MSIPSNANTTPLITRNEDRASQKRKRDESHGSETDTKPFAIQPPSSDPFGRPLILKPVCLLSRTQLPLAYLDTGASGNQLFSAHIRQLDAAVHHGSDQCVLVSKDETQGRLHAIERAGNRTYAICTLRSWVKEWDLVSRQGIEKNVEERPAKRVLIQQKVGAKQPWWAQCAVETPAIVQGGTQQNMLRMLVTQNSAAAVAIANAATPLPENDEVPQHDDLTTTPMPDVLQGLGKQYLEALYASRASLAFFAKGPLARARACLGDKEASADRLDQLIGFLREAVMSITTMEKKYKDGVPAYVRDLPLRPDSEDEKVRAKKKRKWRAKRDKIGMLHGEKDYVEGWWRTEVESGPMINTPEGRDTAIRRRLPHMRSRETHLQIVLILEVFSLETMAQANPAVEKLDDTPNNTEAGAVSKTKTKKPLDLAAVLDSQLDKLCIWQSLETNSPVKGDKESAQPDEADHDDLERFCIEVILPFYLSRVPKQATSVNKKLGGPTTPVPVKQPSSSSRRPGEPAVRRPPEKKPRKSLHRTATETIAPIMRPPPSLQRSATDTNTLEHIKRESSEAPLDSIPLSKPRATGPRQRPSVLHTLSANRREVDLSAKSQANAKRAKQKADAEQKKGEAIAALRKPNRSLATKETAENADKSFARATMKVRPGQPVRRRTGEGGYVAATPQRSRGLPQPNFGVVPASVVPETSARLFVPRQGVVPGSAVPGSAVPSSVVPGTVVSGIVRRPQHDSVQETPSRGFAKYMPQGLARPPGTFESPTASRKSIAVMATPSKPSKTFALPETPIRKPSLSAAALTTMRQTAAMTGERGHQEAADRVQEVREESTGVDTLFGQWDNEYEPLT